MRPFKNIQVCLNRVIISITLCHKPITRDYFHDQSSQIMEKNITLIANISAQTIKYSRQIQFKLPHLQIHRFTSLASGSYFNTHGAVYLLLHLCEAECKLFTARLAALVNGVHFKL